jgi:ketopantoate hydroxymethyltransferase
MPLVHFLLVYDRDQQKLVFRRAYADPAEALTAYEAMEEQHRDERNMEIVLVGADSIETVMLTHGNYFDADPGAAASASPYLAGV